MKRPHFISPFLIVCVCYAILAMCCLTKPAGAQTADKLDDVLTKVNEGLGTTAGGTALSTGKEIIDSALNKAAIKSVGDAWKANKSGASSSAVGSLLEKSANFKSASSTLGIGSTIIDHAGYGSTAAGGTPGAFR